MSRKVIINCGITGAIHVPSLLPYLPITPAEIATPDKARQILGLKGKDLTVY
jgi:uncharacterized protein (DUF849 family)